MEIQTAMRTKYKDYRHPIECRAELAENGDMILTGTCVLFDHEYKLFDYGDMEVYETVDRGAFDHADMADVPLKYNHGDNKGTPARTTAKQERGKLTLIVDDQGVHMRANLLDTTGGTDLYKEVQAGTVPQMSWAFTVGEDGQSYEESEKRMTIHIKSVQRVFDVSAVDFGANPDTSIYARQRLDLDEIKAERDALAKARNIERIKELLKV